MFEILLVLGLMGFAWWRGYANGREKERRAIGRSFKNGGKGD